jgi:50S ribosomal protein L16 3-hydroxylase
MIDLACREDCEARLVLRHGERWQVKHGPFKRRDLARLPGANWSLLVQGVEQFLPRARRLLSQFSFIPYGRLDDLMVSFAPRGGGVGPHFDSYDVFLLQGPGYRRWQVSAQADLQLVEEAPLKILRRFRPEGECVLAPGDMLYLPPGCAHDGVALTDCYTYSIGFRAPSHREVNSAFLAFLEDRLPDAGRYSDPDLREQLHPAAISSAMLARIGHLLGDIRWEGDDVVEFLGTFLTEPKNGVRFVPPARPLARAGFFKAARRRGLSLALRSQMLHRGRRIFINGEIAAVSAEGAKALHALADTRHLPGRALPTSAGTLEVLYRWYRDGYISLASPQT